MRAARVGVGEAAGVADRAADAVGAPLEMESGLAVDGPAHAATRRAVASAAIAGRRADISCLSMITTQGSALPAELREPPAAHLDQARARVA
jgi:hypothetical protein